MSATLSCPGGRNVLSAGLDILGSPPLGQIAEVYIHRSRPISDSSWNTWVSNKNSVPLDLRFWIVCATAGGTIVEAWHEEASTGMGAAAVEMEVIMELFPLD